MTYQPSTLDSQILRSCQEALLVAAERFFDGKRVPTDIRKAFLQTPRHAFAPRYYSPKKGRWIDLSAEPVEDHLPELYADHPLGIYRDSDSRTLATISQPSLVLYMLHLLDLRPGQKVFELGGGSGWNAAMMGRLVGPQGKVCSVEIIESLAATAQDVLKSLNLPQVAISAGDGSAGLEATAPFDRGVFTASAWELPLCFFEQIARDGLLLLVIKLRPGIDLLASLRKRARGRFDSEQHFVCSFVPVTGSAAHAFAPAIPVDSIPALSPAAGPSQIAWSDLRIDGPDIPQFIAFAETVLDCRQSYLLPNAAIGFPEEFTGIHAAPESLTLFNDERICHLGPEDSLAHLRRAAKRWLKAGKPALEDLDFSIYRADAPPAEQSDQWLAPRGQCLLCWRIHSARS